jgi:hypothetical protein
VAPGAVAHDHAGPGGDATTAGVHEVSCSGWKFLPWSKSMVHLNKLSVWAHDQANWHFIEQK